MKLSAETLMQWYSRCDQIPYLSKIVLVLLNKTLRNYTQYCTQYKLVKQQKIVNYLYDYASQ